MARRPAARRDADAVSDDRRDVIDSIVSNSSPSVRRDAHANY
jgi:hypothetical protein